MPFEIIRNDITKMKVDAIVNAANQQLQSGGGVCGAIFNGAGLEKLQRACDEIGNCEVGQAVITSGFNLPSKHIIHTVGPIYEDGNHLESAYLASCYLNSLELAKKNNLKSIAFPLISSGIYGYPKEQALKIAISSIKQFLLLHEMMVHLVVFDNQSFVLSEKRTDSVKRFIDDYYVDEHEIHYGRMRNKKAIDVNDRKQKEVDEIQESAICEKSIQSAFNREIGDVVAKLDETFSQMLLRLIDEKELTDSEIYKKANVDRRLFAKIRSNVNYSPSKKTVLSFAIALELNLDETKDFLSKAGYALSHSLLYDVIIEYFIRRCEYDIFEINATLFHFEQSLLHS